MTGRNGVGVLIAGGLLFLAVANREALGGCPTGTLRTEYGCRPPCGPGTLRQGSLSDACLPTGPANPPATPAAPGPGRPDAP